MSAYFPSTPLPSTPALPARPTPGAFSAPVFPALRAVLWARPSESTPATVLAWKSTYLPGLRFCPGALSQLCDVGAGYGEGALPASSASVPLAGDFVFTGSLDPWHLELRPPSSARGASVAVCAAPLLGWRGGGGAGAPAPAPAPPCAPASPCAPLQLSLSYALVRSAADFRGGGGGGAQHTLTVRAEIRVPTLTARVRELGPAATPSLADTPLTAALLSTGLTGAPSPVPGLQCGPLTLDAARHAVPLLFRDPLSRSAPVVGVWLRAPAGAGAAAPPAGGGAPGWAWAALRHPAFRATAAWLATEPALGERVGPREAPRAFLVAVLPPLGGGGGGAPPGSRRTAFFEACTEWCGASAGGGEGAPESHAWGTISTSLTVAVARRSGGGGGGGWAAVGVAVGEGCPGAAALLAHAPEAGAAPDAPPAVEWSLLPSFSRGLREEFVALRGAAAAGGDRALQPPTALAESITAGGDAAASAAAAASVGARARYAPPPGAHARAAAFSAPTPSAFAAVFARDPRAPAAPAPPSPSVAAASAAAALAATSAASSHAAAAALLAVHAAPRRASPAAASPPSSRARATGAGTAHRLGAARTPPSLPASPPSPPPNSSGRASPHRGVWGYSPPGPPSASPLSRASLRSGYSPGARAPPRPSSADAAAAAAREAAAYLQSRASVGDLDAEAAAIAAAALSRTAAMQREREDSRREREAEAAARRAREALRGSRGAVLAAAAGSGAGGSRLPTAAAAAATAAAAAAATVRDFSSSALPLHRSEKRHSQGETTPHRHAGTGAPPVDAIWTNDAASAAVSKAMSAARGAAREAMALLERPPPPSPPPPPPPSAPAPAPAPAHPLNSSATVRAAAIRDFSSRLDALSSSLSSAMGAPSPSQRAAARGAEAAARRSAAAAAEGALVAVAEVAAAAHASVSAAAAARAAPPSPPPSPQNAIARRAKAFLKTLEAASGRLQEGLGAPLPPLEAPWLSNTPRGGGGGGGNAAAAAAGAAAAAHDFVAALTPNYR
jgi:hypothetical protein